MVSCTLVKHTYPLFSLFQRTNKLCKEFKKIIPNSTVFYRRGLDLKKIIPQAMSRSFTDIVVINENMKVPSILYTIPIYVFVNVCVIMSILCKGIGTEAAQSTSFD